MANSNGVPTACPQCGEIHVKCSAHRKIDGKPCGQPIRAGGVCRKHGGNAPQVLAAEQQRQEAITAREQALAAARTYGLVIDETPHEGLLRLYGEACGLVEFWRTQVTDMNERGPWKDHKEREWHPLMAHGAQGGMIVHPFVIEHENAIGLAAKLSVACIKAGIEEKRLKLEAAKAETVLSNLKASLADAELDPEQQRRVLRAFGDRIRALVAA